MTSSDAGIAVLLLVLCSAVPSLATVYTVGDSNGWTMGVDYGKWTMGKTFMVGDNLVFNYGSGHTVDEVNASDYGTCSVGSPIKTDNSGTTNITLDAAGTYYYICGVIGHCGSGMKLTVTVGGGATASPAGTPPSSNTNTTTTTTQPMTVPNSSSSGTVSPFIAMLITWIALFEFFLS